MKTVMHTSKVPQQHEKGYIVIENLFYGKHFRVETDKKNPEIHHSINEPLQKLQQVSSAFSEYSVPAELISGKRLCYASKFLPSAPTSRLSHMKSSFYYQSETD